MAGSRGEQYNLTISFGQTFMSTGPAPKEKEVRETEQFVSKKKIIRQMSSSNLVKQLNLTKA